MSSSIEVCVWLSSDESQLLIDSLSYITNLFHEKSNEERIAKVLISDKRGANQEFSDVEKISDILTGTIPDSISVKLFFPCYRFQPDIAYEGGVWTLITFNRLLFKQEGFVANQGHVQIVIDNSGPFFERPEDSDINQKKSEENINALFELILSISKFEKCKKMHVYTDVSAYYLLNAHLIFYKEISDLLIDIDLLKSKLTTGVLFPIQSKLSDIRYHLHPYRTDQQMDSLLTKINERVGAKTSDRYRTLEQAIEKGEYDIFTNENAFVVLDYPFFLNRFVDSFVLSYF